MFKSQRFTKLIIAIIFATALLTACGQAAAPPATKSAQQTTAVQTTAATTAAAPATTTTIAAETSAPIVLGYSTWNGGQIQKDEEAWFEQYMIDNPNVKINTQFITTGDYWTVINTLIAAGECPDMFFTSTPLTEPLWENGLVYDLYPLYKDIGIDMFEEFVDTTLDVTPGKNVIALTHGLTTIIIYYNLELFDELGVEYPPRDPMNPWTWDDFVQTAKLLTRDMKGNTPDDPGFDPNNIKSYGTLLPTFWYQDLLQSNNASFLHLDENRRATGLALTEPNGRHVLESLNNLIFVDRVAPSIAFAKSLPSTVAMFQNKQVGMVFSGAWLYSEFYVEGIDVGLAPPPMFQKRASLSWGSAYSISTQTKHLKEAFALYSTFLDPEKNPDLNKNMLPSKKSMYQPGAIELWMDALGDFFNEDYRRVVPPMVLNGFMGEWLTTRDYTPIVGQVIFPILDTYWLGEADLDTVCKEIEAATKDFFK